VLIQKVATVFFVIGMALFAFAIIAVSGYHADDKPVPEDLINSCSYLTMFAIGFAVSGGLILLLGKFGEEWFKD
jgi:hypothetical protein